MKKQLNKFKRLLKKEHLSRKLNCSKDTFEPQRNPSQSIYVNSDGSFVITASGLSDCIEIILSDGAGRPTIDLKKEAIVNALMVELLLKEALK